MLDKNFIKYETIEGSDSHDIVRKILEKVRLELFHRE